MSSNAFESSHPQEGMLFDCDSTPLVSRKRRPSIKRATRGLSLCNLGSGSGGNCTVLRHGDRAILIDAGFGPRTTSRRLAQAGLAIGDIAAICLTHLDRDHFRPTWIDTLIGLSITVFCDRWHVEELRRLPGGNKLDRAGLLQSFPAGGQPWPITLDHNPSAPKLTVHTHRCQHDRQGTVAYRFDAPHERGSVGYATDLGHVPQGMIDMMVGVDLLCIEANYDQQMTKQSSRPSFVNRRNMSDSGHLSNEQSLEAVQAICRRCPAGGPSRVLLLHRSSQCNHPTKVRRVFAADSTLNDRVTLTEQRKRTRWFEIKLRPAMLRQQLLLGA